MSGVYTQYFTCKYDFWLRDSVGGQDTVKPYVPHPNMEKQFASNIDYETFVDERDGQEYKYTTIGNQVWMAENLKFDAPYSVCYDKIDGFCDTFGRYYSLHENGEDFGLFDQELLATICPAGWRVPSVDDWSILISEMGGGEKALSRLYSSENFGENFMKSSDDCGFNSLPAGSWLLGGELASEYTVSTYWTSSAQNLQITYACLFSYGGITFGVNAPKMTLRCIRN
jgi:uncharacterized protein (TIGR02145 family)